MSLRRISALLAVAATIAAACGTAKALAPELALRQAARSTFDRDSATYTISVGGSDAAVRALMEEDDARALSLLRSSSLTVSVDEAGGKDLLALDLDLGDLDHAVELRFVDDTLYARADVKRIADVLGADPRSIDTTVAGAEEAGFGFLREAVAGKWLSVDTRPLGDLLKGIEQGGAPIPKLGMDQWRNLLKALGDTFGGEVGVERLGKEDAGDHLRLTVPLRRVYQRLLPVLSEAGMRSPRGLPSVDDIPDRQVSADVWLRDGRISRAELDLAQFASHSAGRVPLRVDVGPLRQPVAAPRDAIPVNLLQLLGRLAAVFTGGMGG
jgi:hypothetical protein